MGKININSIRNKFDPLIAAVAGIIDIILITETITDSTFLQTSFNLMAIMYPTDMIVTLMVMAFWFMFAMTLGHV